MSKVIIFDVGGVIATDAYNVVLEQVYGNNKIPHDQFESLMKTAHASWKTYKYGTIDEETFWMSIINEHYAVMHEYEHVLENFQFINGADDASRKRHYVQYLSKLLRSNLRLFTETLDLIEKLENNLEQHPKLAAIGILSNHSKEWSHYIYSEMSNGRVAKLFEKNLFTTGSHSSDLIIWSCDVNLAKPEAEIYELMIRRVQQQVGQDIQPGDICFIDDKDRNLEVAKKLGIHTILYDAFLPEQYKFSDFEKEIYSFLQ